MEDLFRRRINFMLARGLQTTATLNLLDARYGEAAQALAALDPANHAAYLAWLIRWNRLPAARQTWARLAAAGPPDEEIALKYLHFLISKKEIQAALEIRPSAGGAGMTNGDFEKAPNSRGFDWRLGTSRERLWQAKHAPGQGRGGSAALEVRFYGLANLSYNHLYQIVPVTPGVPQRVTFWWRALRLTTDQGPFVEVQGYDGPGFRQTGPMLTGSAGWRREVIEFTPPPGCRAVSVRLRRRPSNRFDNRIKGTLWLDDFRLEALPAGTAQS
jgi:hypothetical protein